MSCVVQLLGSYITKSSRICTLPGLVVTVRWMELLVTDQRISISSIDVFIPYGHVLASWLRHCKSPKIHTLTPQVSFNEQVFFRIKTPSVLGKRDKTGGKTVSFLAAPFILVRESRWILLSYTYNINQNLEKPSQYPQDIPHGGIQSHSEKAPKINERDRIDLSQTIISKFKHGNLCVTRNYKKGRVLKLIV